MSNDWLKRILADTEQRVAQKPEWERSEYAQHELARLKVEAQMKGILSVTPNATADAVKKDR
jgi:hypothetical protein